MIYLVGLILVVEIFRLILNIRDAKRIDYMNQKAMERQEKAFEFEKVQQDEWKKLRQLELAELREMAKGSKELEDIISSFKEAKNV